VACLAQFTGSRRWFAQPVRPAHRQGFGRMGTAGAPTAPAHALWLAAAIWPGSAPIRVIATLPATRNLPGFCSLPGVGPIAH